MQDSAVAVSPRVLVADDQPDILDALRLLLRDAGFRADSARSAQDVRERLVASEYDLLLMDLNYARDTTSGREGLELLDEVHHFDPTLPVIVMTGWGSIETAVEAMRRGARTFVHKPWDNDVLAQTVRREVADGAAARRAAAREQRVHDDARRIQRALLPGAMPRLDRGELAVAWQPAADVGGDYYDATPLPGGRVLLTIGDVAGKGMPAALLMANLQASVRAFAGSDVTPPAIAQRVNQALCANTQLETLVTFFCAVLDTGTRMLTFCNAGHNPPLLVRASGAIETLDAGGMVLGAFAAAEFEGQSVALRPGDRLVLFTDGITEAQDADGSFYGDDRLQAVVIEHRGSPAAPLVEAVVADVRRFTGGRFGDDATVIALAVE